MGTDPTKMPTDALPMTHPHVTFAYIKHTWTSGAKTEAYKYLKNNYQPFFKFM